MNKGKSFEISQQQVLEAYKLVKANKGAAGVDGITFDIYEKDLKNNLYKLWNRMSSGSYFPKAVKGVEIPKKNGKIRLLGVPTIEDRVAQMVVKQDFEPLIEPIFCDDSYGYRPNRSAIDAIRVTRERCWKIDWLVEFDIKGLFDNIDHQLLMQVVRKHTDCKWMILYIERWLKAPMLMPNGQIQERKTGISQGGVASPILANLFMHYAFDRWMVTQNPNNPWARFADDAVVHCHSKAEAENLLNRLRVRMKACGLDLHPDKTRIIYCMDDNRRSEHEHTSFDFLGYTFRNRMVKAKTGEYFGGFNPAVSKKAKQSLRDRLREIRRQGGFNKIEELAAAMNPVIRGWSNYFMQFTPSEAKNTLQEVNLTLVRWAMRKKKSLRRRPARSLDWLGQVAKTRPDLFVHWEMGLAPATG